VSACAGFIVGIASSWSPSGPVMVINRDKIYDD